jgi:streptomycin 6-kinase
VLKVARHGTDEWRSGEIAAAFGGSGVVRVYEHTDGAVLLERLSPGTRLAELSLNGRDDEATEVLASVIEAMSPRVAVTGVPNVSEFAEAFDRYESSGDAQIPAGLVDAGGWVFSDLAESQAGPRLLHGDLHHYNVLLDSRRGWLAIDPKGVVGELEYEIGAALRNPFEMPGLLAEPSTIYRRIDCFATRLKLDAERSLAWAFGQAVLSAVWLVEDGFTVGPVTPSIVLANTLRQML